jgi:hypothetical protein
MKANWILLGMKRALATGAALVAACSFLAAGLSAHAQTTAANLSPDLAEIVKLHQAPMSDDVIVSFIKGSGKVYNLSGDDLIYLTGQGISQTVISALLQTKNGAGVATPPPSMPAPAPAPASAPPPVAAPPPGLVDVFSTDAGLNPSLWLTQSPLLMSLAQWNTAASVPPVLGFGPAGLQMSGLNGPNEFTGIQSVGAFSPPFALTATVSGLEERGIPFQVYLVSPDLRQFLTVAGHLGGAGGPREGIGIRTPFGGARIPLGGERSPEHGVWANWTGSAQPISALGSRIFPEPFARVPYTISMTVGADGLASVSLLDQAGIALGALNAMPVGTGPFNIVLASRREGPTFANWQSVQLTSLAPPPPPPPPVAVAPEVPTIDYFQAHLTPYGQWVDVPGVGAAWIPAEANNPLWRPYTDAGHWEYTDAGWFWQSDYPWGDIAFHYGRWIRNDFTAGRWAWVPAYDWAPSWVAWREGEGGMGWAPLPWGVEYHTGVGLFWHGGAVGVDVDFGLGFDAFVFVGSDHFWGGDYHRYAFDHDHAREFYGHSQFHAGYRVEGGHLRAEGLGRDHIAAITHHEVVEHRAVEMRHTEETHNVAARAAAHPEVARASLSHATPNGAAAARGEAPGRGKPAEASTAPRGEALGRATPAATPAAATPGRATTPITTAPARGGSTTNKTTTPAKPAAKPATTTEKKP